MFEVEFGFGELVVLVGFGFEGFSEVALFLLEGEFVVEEGLGVRD